MSDDDQDEASGWGALAKRLAREALLLALLAPVVLLALGWLRGPGLPEQAPDFRLVDLDGQEVSLSTFRGRTVVLNFWATWCGPCRLEAPSFTAFAAAHPDVVVLGLVEDGPPNKVRAVADRIGLDYRVVSADQATLEAYDIGVFPTTVIVNPDGSVRWSHAGLLFRPQLAWLTGHLY